jgi:SAM-dependent methyltransferase
MKDNLTDYKEFPGPKEFFDIKTPAVFNTLIDKGMTENSFLLDVGCGPLRIGRHLIIFLSPNRYYGLEPNKKMVKLGLKNEVKKKYGSHLLQHKNPLFTYNSDFDLTDFDGVLFNIVLAHQVFIHCGPQQLQQFLRNICPFLAPDASILLTIKIGEENFARGTNKMYKGASHEAVCYTEKAFHKILNQHGFLGIVVKRKKPHSIIHKKRGLIQTWFMLSSKRIDNEKESTEPIS